MPDLTHESVRTAFERNEKALRLRPYVGVKTAVTTVRVREGLTCEITEGPWTLIADMSDKWGGDNRGPNPGIYGRAALGSCIAMTYMMWGAKLGIPLSDVNIEIHADYDTRGMCGVGNVPAGYAGIRYVVTIESTAPEEEILRLLDTADARSDFLVVFREPTPVIREVHIRQPQV
jgi:uncharacterized OsmC-like protein